MEHIQKQEQIDIDHLIQTIVSNTWDWVTESRLKTTDLNQKKKTKSKPDDSSYS